MDRRWYAVLLALPALYLVVNGLRFIANGKGVGLALLLLGCLLVPLSYASLRGTRKSSE